MPLIVFSKLLKDYSIPTLIDLAHSHGYSGYDLCVRPGYPVSPENANEALPAAVRRCSGRPSSGRAPGHRTDEPDRSPPAGIGESAGGPEHSGRTPAETGLLPL